MNSEEAIISYLKFRKYENMGYIKYGNFKKIISFVLDSHNDYYNRKLFLSLVSKGFLIKKKNIKKSYIYKFQPNPKFNIIEKKIIDPTNFIVTWD
jgi:hypothetical protein|tara:strand:+ start:1280 stop:1564 length:285 start_codon:yes stop_codon:yes gene_type:complete